MLNEIARMLNLALERKELSERLALKRVIPIMGKPYIAFLITIFSFRL
jgi:hypothetical protein